METLFENILTASFHGSVVIVAVLILRLILRKAPRKYLCYLWLLAGIRLLMPFEIQSDLSLQPQIPPGSGHPLGNPGSGGTPNDAGYFPGHRGFHLGGCPASGDGTAVSGSSNFPGRAAQRFWQDN